jgi:hypothetical protein
MKNEVQDMVRAMTRSLVEYKKAIFN